MVFVLNAPKNFIRIWTFIKIEQEMKMKVESAMHSYQGTHHILVVDDEDIREVFQELIEMAGYKCSIASRGEDALKILDNHTVDVVITDIRMPGMDGIQLLKRVKEKYSADVIVMSGYTEDFTFEEIVIAGASDFIHKPITHQNLTLRLERVIRERTLSAERRKARIELESAHRELQVAYHDTINRLVLAAEYKDEDTADHIVRISRYSELLAEKYGMSAVEVQNIRNAAPMHDIGKIGIPDHILLKPGKLTDAEFEIMKTHTLIGADILAKSRANILQVAEEISISHHEKWDGTGYPLKLAGEKIPIAGRIVGLADVFDALTTRRPYKKPYPIQVACEIIKTERNKHFDPDLVDIFLENLDAIEQIKMAVSLSENISLPDFVWSERDQFEAGNHD